MDSRESDWESLLQAAAEFQKLVLNTVLVGGTAVALHLGHRFSRDADHVIPDLRHRFDELIALLEGRHDWVTHELRAPKLILGSFQGVQTGLRQLMRSKPLEVVEVATPQGTLRVPTLEELLRIKGWLIVFRNATRDFIDFAALSAAIGSDRSRAALATFDECYRDLYRPDAKRDVSPRLQLARQLADPKPKDLGITDVANYKGIVKPWDEWSAIAAQTRRVAVLVTESQLGPS